MITDLQVRSTTLYYPPHKICLSRIHNAGLVNTNLRENILSDRGQLIKSVCMLFCGSYSLTALPNLPGASEGEPQYRSRSGERCRVPYLSCGIFRYTPNESGPNRERWASYYTDKIKIRGRVKLKCLCLLTAVEEGEEGRFLGLK